MSELHDLEAVTVPTPEVQQVDRAVREYTKMFGSSTEPLPKLLLAAKGDFGTGKTHLMLYARSVLTSTMEERRQGEDSNSISAKPPITIMAVSSEAPIEDWYTSELGPLLIDIAQPRELVRDLLSQVAVNVAKADPDPDVQRLADEFGSSRKALYQVFREPGTFDVSAVDEQFSAAITAACPRTSRSFRRAIEALRWEETSEIAEDWLSGNELSAADMARIGVRLEGDRTMRAANSICAIASLSRQLGRPFALFIDEFEHLTRFDSRNGSKRNITWIKRLVEALARRGAMVFISGHWEAWAQQGDFLDRFVGGRPIQLVRLTSNDVMDVIRVRAGEGAWPGFTMDAARSVVEATSGNIRRVITVLYDLWNSPSGPQMTVTDEAVRLAAQRRLQPGSEIGIIPAIEAAVRAKGAQLTRNELFGATPTAVDIAVRLGSELRLVVQVVHARDELALIGSGETFAELVKQIRRDHPQARGLVVTLGAVLEKHLLALDAAFAETDLVNGEEPGIVERLPDLVNQALGPASQPMPSTPPESLKALDETRTGAIDRANAQIARSQDVLGTDSRAEAVREALVPDAGELARAKEVASRDRVFHDIMEEIGSAVRTQYLVVLLRRPTPIVVVMLGLLIATLSNAIPSYLQYVNGLSDVRSVQVPLPYQWLVQLGYVAAGLAVIAGLVLAARLYFDLIEFRQYRRQEIQILYENGLPMEFLVNRDNEMREALSRYGPRGARLSLAERAKQAK